MASGRQKNSRASRLLAATLVGLAALFLISAAMFARPRNPEVFTVKAGYEAVSPGGSNTVKPHGAIEEVVKRVNSKQRIPPPPPPAAADKASPAKPAQPPEPPEPAEPAAEQEKEQPAKEKNNRNIKKGALIEAPQPTYPEEVKKQKIQGIVAVEITIGEEGNVISAKAKSGPAELYAVSEEAALKARFHPTHVDGKPAKVTGVMTYNFALK